MNRIWMVMLVSCVAVACGDPTGGDRDGSLPGMDAGRIDGGELDGAALSDAGPPRCTSDAECDDGVDCTADTCTVTTGACRHQVVPALCPAGSSCHPVRGCEMGRPCATDEDCADGDACTTNERCDPAARVCVVDPLDGDGDGDPPRVCGGMDCDDSDAEIYAGAAERCNTLDDDCNGIVDEGADAACGAQEVCSAGECVCSPSATDCCVANVPPRTCTPECDITMGEFCNDGTCQVYYRTCDPACDTATHFCNPLNGNCENVPRTCDPTCDSTEWCNDGTCERVPVCDPPCTVNETCV